MMGIRKKLMGEGGKIETETEGLMVGRRGEERWRIAGVGKREMGRMLKELEGWIGTREEGVMTIIGGGF